MMDTGNIVIISPQLLINVGMELEAQSKNIKANLDRASELLEQTCSKYNDERVNELYSKIKEQSAKMEKLYEAMVTFGEMLGNIGNQWQTLRDNGELDKIIRELEAE